MKQHSRILLALGILIVCASVLPALSGTADGFAAAGINLAMSTSVNLNLSQLYQRAVQKKKEIQHQKLYSLVTLPAAINAAGGISFFGDTESTVGRQRTNMTRPNEIPGGTNYEIHGIGIKFTASPTVTFTNINTAVRDAWFQLKINNSERLVRHLTEFFPSATVNPSFSAAAGDNPVVPQVGVSFILPLAIPIPLVGAVNFTSQVFFITDAGTSLGNTVMGMYFDGLIDRGSVTLDLGPVDREMAQG